jgi:hypothetical protein
LPADRTPGNAAALNTIKQSYSKYYY